MIGGREAPNEIFGWLLGRRHEGITETQRPQDEIAKRHMPTRSRRSLDGHTEE